MDLKLVKVHGILKKAVCSDKPYQHSFIKIPELSGIFLFGNVTISKKILLKGS